MNLSDIAKHCRLGSATPTDLKQTKTEAREYLEDIVGDKQQWPRKIAAFVFNNTHPTNYLRFASLCFWVVNGVDPRLYVSLMNTLAVLDRSAQNSIRWTLKTWGNKPAVLKNITAWNVVSKRSTTVTGATPLKYQLMKKKVAPIADQDVLQSFAADPFIPSWLNKKRTDKEYIQDQVRAGVMQWPGNHRFNKDGSLIKRKATALKKLKKRTKRRVQPPRKAKRTWRKAPRKSWRKGKRAIRVGQVSSSNVDPLPPAPPNSQAAGQKPAPKKRQTADQAVVEEGKQRERERVYQQLMRERNEDDEKKDY